MLRQQQNNIIKMQRSSADNNTAMLLTTLLTEVRKNGEAINSMNLTVSTLIGRLASFEESSRQNATKMSKMEDMLMKSIVPFQKILGSSSVVDATEMPVSREQAEYNLDQKLDASMKSMIEDDEILNNVRYVLLVFTFSS